VSKCYGKGKCKLSLCLIKHLAIKIYVGLPHAFLTSTLAGVVWSASPALPLGERGPNIHHIGSWVGPRAGLDAVEKKEFELRIPSLLIRSVFIILSSWI
jgi:hypothetical protein